MATTQSKHGRKFDEEFKREVAALAASGTPAARQRAGSAVHVMEGAQGALGLPAPELAIHRLPRREVDGQQLPSATR